jgi:hypothetical protein
MIFLNCDRLRERIVFNRISRCLRGDQDEADLEERFFPVHLPTIPYVVSIGYIEQVIAVMNKMIRGVDGEPAKGLFIIDPLRTAFMGNGKSGDENDSVVMTQILAPLRQFTRESGWAILLLHHNNRARNEYAGNASVAANTDGIWNISRERTSTTADLEIQTRDGVFPTMCVTEDAGGLSLTSDKEAKDKAQREADAQREAKLVKFMDLFPGTADAALTLDQLVDLCRQHPDPDLDLARTAIQDRLREAERPGRHPRLENIGNGKKGNPNRWFRV